jgi:hypothetical protein
MLIIFFISKCRHKLLAEVVPHLLAEVLPHLLAEVLPHLSGGNDPLANHFRSC